MMFNYIQVMRTFGWNPTDLELQVEKNLSNSLAAIQHPLLFANEQKTMSKGNGYLKTQLITISSGEARPNNFWEEGLNILWAAPARPTKLSSSNLTTILIIKYSIKYQMFNGCHNQNILSNILMSQS